MARVYVQVFDQDTQKAYSLVLDNADVVLQANNGLRDQIDIVGTLISGRVAKETDHARVSMRQ